MPSSLSSPGLENNRVYVQIEKHNFCWKEVKKPPVCFRIIGLFSPLHGRKEEERLLDSRQPTRCEKWPSLVFSFIFHHFLFLSPLLFQPTNTWIRHLIRDGTHFRRKSLEHLFLSSLFSEIKGQTIWLRIHACSHEYSHLYSLRIITAAL